MISEQRPSLLDNIYSRRHKAREWLEMETIQLNNDSFDIIRVV